MFLQRLLRVLGTAAGCAKRTSLAESRASGFATRKHVNSNYFSSIRTPEQSYWLGFLFADGSVSVQDGQQHVLRLSISERDIEHMHKFTRALESEYRVVTFPGHGYSQNLQVRTQISDAQLVRDLIRYGCVPNKTQSLRWPSLRLEDAQTNHFVRGYFDGNGCISIDRTQRLQIVFYGRRAFLLRLCSVLQAQAVDVPQQPVQRRRQ